MIDFIHLDRKELTKNGLVFGTAEEAELFADVIRDEIEVRVGEAITQALGRDKKLLHEFDLCEAPEDAQAWLEKNCPNYREIVEKTSSAFAKEIMEYKDRIPGLRPGDGTGENE